MASMTGVYLPGDATVEHREVPVPQPGPGQVLVEMRASSICGSDIRAIYREHLGRGPEAYQNVIAGHEPCGRVCQVGPDCRRFSVGDRVVAYHIAGCGVCEDCRHGYMISCTSDRRAAYGWQRDGGHAAYLLADESTLVHLPDELTYVDGALCACGFGTVWEALTRAGLSGADRLLITGLGPVGLAAAMLGRALGAPRIVGTDLSPERCKLAEELDLVDAAVAADGDALSHVLDATGPSGYEVTIDCSGAAPARKLALEATGRWGRCVFVGEGGTVDFEVSPLLIHKQVTLYGSWVTSVKHLADLVERLARWGIHPETTCTDRLPLALADEAYRLADEGKGGKVCIVFEE